MAITGKPHDISQDIEIIQGAIAGEHAGIAAYRIAGGSGLLAPDTLKVALLFKDHHEGHRDALEKLVTEIGATPVPPKSDDEYVADLKLAALKSQADILSRDNARARSREWLYQPDFDHPRSRAGPTLRSDFGR
ncbi:ferritin-like domain-containing protein [Sphingobium chungangianum]